ncbi:MAG: hypothetical protein CM1200mP2_44190 [Planctomycetaceae bacterium]|nr:MAG: hypothetical protein CM1200mP2_44190 [Planctomycetaceae bacterium]
MGYAFFNRAGSPACRCALARVTVNGKNLGIYSHVETVNKPLLRRGFGDDRGTLYEGTVTDFHEGWEGSFEKKVGKDRLGRPKNLNNSSRSFRVKSVATRSWGPRRSVVPGCQPASRHRNWPGWPTTGSPTAQAARPCKRSKRGSRHSEKLSPR